MHETLTSTQSQPAPPSLRVRAYLAKRAVQTRIERMKLAAWKSLYELPGIPLSALASDTTELAPAITERLCLPPYRGPQDHDDYTPLIQIARSMKPHVIVELGTAHGNTVANLCHHVPGAKVYTVNAPVEKQSGTFVTFRLEEDEIGYVYRANGFTARVVQIFENTLNLDLSKYLTEPTVDLAVVDACHDTEYVVNDFHKVAPFVRSGGIVLLHDTHPSMKGHLKGSYLACMKLRRQGYDVRHLEGTWWGVWTKP